MSDQNRGAYTPQSEAPLAFDARHSRGPGERPMPLTLLASGGVLVVLVILLALFFFKGKSATPDEAPPPIDTMKSAPPVADAKPAERTGLQVYADGEPLPEAPAFAAPPEAPATRPAPATVPSAAPVAVVPPARPIPAPVQQPAVQPVTPPRPAPAPVAAAPAAPRPAATPRPAAATTPPPTSTAQVQIGAFSSAALAEDGWSETAALLPGQMAGKTKSVQRGANDAGAVVYRTAVGGFASRQEAAAFCEALKARGGNCFVRN